MLKLKTMMKIIRPFHVLTIFCTFSLLNKALGAPLCPGDACVEGSQTVPLVSTEPNTSDINALLKIDAGFVPDEPWYTQWPIYLLILVLVGIVVGCLICCERSREHRVFACECACCVPRMRRASSDHDSAGSCYPPPRYSRCSSLYRMPPPYTEVTSKPDMYPLVITCGNNDKGNSGGRGSYLMVHYFKNAVRPQGSMSATSTAESLNSSCICNAANEANSIIPPPYSFAESFDEWPGAGYNSGSMLRSVSSLTGSPRSPRAPPRSRTAPAPPTRLVPDMSPEESFRNSIITSPLRESPYNLDLDLDFEVDEPRRPKVGTSPDPTPVAPPHRTPYDVALRMFEIKTYRQRLLDAISSEITSSPPQPTSPTESPNEYSSRTGIDLLRKMPAALCKASLYMSFSPTNPERPSRISSGRWPRPGRGFSRSAPTTPSGVFRPNILSFPQRVSGTPITCNCEEESNLLLDTDNLEHKF